MLVEAEVWTVARTDQGNAVLIRPIGLDAAVPIFIGQLEAQSILIGLGNVPMPRPLTHDLILSILKNVEIRVERIEITELKEGTYYSQIILNAKSSKIVIDSRPSDALAIAVREKCPIFIDEAVVDEAGIATSAVTDENQRPLSTPHDTEITRLTKELEKAVKDENYEKAAELRDKIKEIENS